MGVKSESKGSHAELKGWVISRQACWDIEWSMRRTTREKEFNIRYEVNQ